MQVLQTMLLEPQDDPSRKKCQGMRRRNDECEDAAKCPEHGEITSRYDIVEKELQKQRLDGRQHRSPDHQQRTSYANFPEARSVWQETSGQGQIFP